METNFELVLKILKHFVKVYLIRGLKVGKRILFPVYTIPFPVMKIKFELLDKNETHFIKEVFDQRPGNRRNNSTSC